MKAMTIFAALAVAGIAYAQDPVPTRIKNEIYGTGATSPVTIACDIWDFENEATYIRVSGGAPGDLACLLIDANRAAIPLPFGTLLVAPTALPLLGAFDVRGDFKLPIDLAQAAWINASPCFQGLVIDQRLQVKMSWGLEVAYHEGNQQPFLPYEGPPLTTTLIRTEHPLLDASYEMLVTFDVPTHGWEPRLVRTEMTGGELQVYLNLIAPAPEWDVLPLPTTVRLPLDLGVDVGALVRVWVWESVAMTMPPEEFYEAAIIDPNY